MPVEAPSWLSSGDTSWQITAATLVGLMSAPGVDRPGRLLRWRVRDPLGGSVACLAGRGLSPGSISTRCSSSSQRFDSGNRSLREGAIGRACSRRRPHPLLFPADAEHRRPVEDAERFGEEVMQRCPRHILWVAFSRKPAAARLFLADARLGFPAALAAPLIRPVVALMSRLKGATDAAARSELRRIPAALSHVDSLIEKGTIGRPTPNAVDFQLAAQVRILMCLDDLRPTVERH